MVDQRAERIPLTGFALKVDTTLIRFKSDVPGWESNEQKFQGIRFGDHGIYGDRYYGTRWQVTLASKEDLKAKQRLSKMLLNVVLRGQPGLTSLLKEGDEVVFENGAVVRINKDASGN